MMKQSIWPALALAALLGGTTAQAQSASPRQAPPAATASSAPADAEQERRAAVLLVRNSLIGLHHAVQTGNFHVFRTLASPAFQQENSHEKLVGAFASLRANGVDMAPVAILEPRFSVAQIDADGYLHLNGQMGPVTAPFTFETTYMPVNGLWKLLTINVGVNVVTGQRN